MKAYPRNRLPASDLEAVAYAQKALPTGLARI